MYLMLLKLVILPWIDCSLLSRFRYQNEYAAPPESVMMPEDIPDDMYENLIDERPELEAILAPLRKTKVRRPKIAYIKKSSTVPDGEPSVYHEFEYPGVYREQQADDEELYSVTKSGIVRYSSHPADYNASESRVAARLARMPILSRNHTYYNDSRRQVTYPDGFDQQLWHTSPKIAHCYYCGHRFPDSAAISSEPLCHNMFDSQDWRARTMQRYFRAVCLYNWKWRNLKIKVYHPYTYRGDKEKFAAYMRGYSLKHMGDFIPGCYKRFLDIGTVYTARGCRRIWPDSPSVLTGNRFLRLEWLMRRYKDQCISSPYASLTPFSRSVSLFARYHVCVCSGKYCNKATVSELQHMTLLLVSFIIVVFNAMNS